MPGSFARLCINGAILTGCAVFIAHEYRQQALLLLMLFLPLTDRTFRQNLPALHRTNTGLLITAATLFLLALLPSYDKLKHPLQFSASMVLLTALPEEWFFRGYVQRQLYLLLAGNRVLAAMSAASIHPATLSAIVTSSAFFTLLHLPTQGVNGLLVFFPSLVLAWLYQVKNDMILVIMVHSLFNLVYMLYLYPALHGHGL